MKHATWFCALLFFAIPANGQTDADFFNDDIVHEISLEVHPHDWQNLKDHFLDNTFYPADMHWRFDGRSIDVAQVGIRSRGTGTRSPIKPGLLVEFDRYNKNQRFLGLRSVVLRNNIQDASMLHERVAFALMRKLGMNAPRVAHVRLYLNHQYLGLYTIVENIDKPFLKEHFGNDDGYLFRYNYDVEDTGYFFEYRGSDPALYSPKPFQPETHENNPNPERIEAMIRAINQASDAEFANAVGQYLDLHDFMVEIAVEAFIAESDGMLGEFGLNNFYLYRSPGSTPFRILPWDKSQAFLDVNRSVIRHIGVNVLSRRAFAVAPLQALFIDTVLRASELSGGPGGWLEQEIIKEYNQVREAAREDPNKQCYPTQSGGIIFCTNEAFESGIVDMVAFARLRQSIIAQQFAELGYVLAQGPVSAEAPTDGDGVVTTSGGTDTLPAVVSQGGAVVEVRDWVATGLALLNTSVERATVTFYFTDSTGHSFGDGVATIPSNGEMMLSLSESASDDKNSIPSSFTFASTAPLAVAAVGTFAGGRSEFLMSAEPLIDLEHAAMSAVISFSPR